VYYGEITNEENRHLPDLTPREWVVITPVIAMAIVMGVFPAFFLAPTAPAIDKLVQRVAQSEGRRIQAPAPAQVLPETTPPTSPEARLVR
jgi:NADH-quinone oxidoreductase subunit M